MADDDLKQAQEALDQEDQVTDSAEAVQTEEETVQTAEETVQEAQVEEPAVVEVPAEEEVSEETAEVSETPEAAEEEAAPESEETAETESTEEEAVTEETPEVEESHPGARWYVVHTYSGHENRVATTLKQRIESEHLENKIFDVLVPTQEKIEIRSGRKEQVKEKIFPGYLLVKMILDDETWLAVRTTQGVTSFIGMGSKPTPISNAEVASIVKFAQQGGQPTYKQVFNDGDTVKIVDGPFTEFIGKVDNVDKERGKVRVLVSIFGRETPVELDFLQVQKL